MIPRTLSSSSNKPKPHERKMERRATVGFGLDRSSKKSRLLRWCQIVTQEYDVSINITLEYCRSIQGFIIILLLYFLQNISIGDFGKSFSNGLAFCAMLHHFIPDKIPYSTLNDKDKVSYHYCIIIYMYIHQKIYDQHMQVLLCCVYSTGT